MSFIRWMALVVAVACGAAVPAGRGDDKKPGSDPDVLKPFFDYLAKNDIKLERDTDSSWWVVTDPKTDGYRVAVSLKTFAETAGEKEMLDELKKINLAHELNAPARLAMGGPSLQIIDPAKAPPLDQIPTTAKLKKLFAEYKPPVKT